jgi:hypothetical protein
MVGNFNPTLALHTSHFGLFCSAFAAPSSGRHQTSTTYEKAIDLPAMRLVNVATKKSYPIQRIEVFTKSVGVELPLKDLKGPFAQQPAIRGHCLRSAHMMLFRKIQKVCASNYPSCILSQTQENRRGHTENQSYVTLGSF